LLKALLTNTSNAHPARQAKCGYVSVGSKAPL
jgi:hypothetical protein